MIQNTHSTIYIVYIRLSILILVYSNCSWHMLKHIWYLIISPRFCRKPKTFQRLGRPVTADVVKCSKYSHVSKTIVNHPQIYHFYGCFFGSFDEDEISKCGFLQMGGPQLFRICKYFTWKTHGLGVLYLNLNKHPYYDNITFHLGSACAAYANFFVCPAHAQQQLHGESWAKIIEFTRKMWTNLAFLNLLNILVIRSKNWANKNIDTEMERWWEPFFLNNPVVFPINLDAGSGSLALVQSDAPLRAE